MRFRENLRSKNCDLTFQKTPKLVETYRKSVLYVVLTYVFFCEKARFREKIHVFSERSFCAKFC